MKNISECLLIDDFMRRQCYLNSPAANLIRVSKKRRWLTPWDLDWLKMYSVLFFIRQLIWAAEFFSSCLIGPNSPKLLASEPYDVILHSSLRVYSANRLSSRFRWWCWRPFSFREIWRSTIRPQFPVTYYIIERFDAIIMQRKTGILWFLQFPYPKNDDCEYPQHQ